MYPNLTTVAGIMASDWLKSQMNRVFTCEMCGYLYTKADHIEDCPQCGESLTTKGVNYAM